MAVAVSQRSGDGGDAIAALVKGATDVWFRFRATFVALELQTERSEPESRSVWTRRRPRRCRPFRGFRRFRRLEAVGFVEGHSVWVSRDWKTWNQTNQGRRHERTWVERPTSLEAFLVLMRRRPSSTLVVVAASAWFPEHLRGKIWRWRRVNCKTVLDA